MSSLFLDPMTCELSIPVKLVLSTMSSPLKLSCMLPRRVLVELSVWQSGIDSMCCGQICRKLHFSGTLDCRKLFSGNKCQCYTLCITQCINYFLFSLHLLFPLNCMFFFPGGIKTRARELFSAGERIWRTCCS